MTAYYYIYLFQDPLNGWYAHLDDEQVRGYRLAGYVVANAALEKAVGR